MEADFLADRGSILLFRASLGFMGMGGSGSWGRVFWLVWLAGAHLLGGGEGLVPLVERNPLCSEAVFFYSVLLSSEWGPLVEL